MGQQLKFSLIFLTLLLAFAGCQDASKTTPIVDTSAMTGGLTVYQLASQLDLTVGEAQSTHYILKNSNNTVMIFTHTSGQFYVNGVAKGDVGTVNTRGGQALFSPSLVSKIKASLQAGGSLATPGIGKKGTVTLDPGHGGKDPGAIAINGIHEKVVNLNVARQVASILRQKGINVVMTRDSDVFVELEDRAAVANRNNASLFVSIHSDSREDSSKQGYSVYVSRNASAQSRNIARSLLSSLQTTGISNTGLKTADYRVLVKTKCPAILIEMGHLSNWSDAGKLTNSDFQQKLAASIANGIYSAL